MKPLFTQRGGEFSVENLPACCSPLASCITGKHRRFENEDVCERRNANVRLVRECYNQTFFIRQLAVGHLFLPQLFFFFLFFFFSKVRFPIVNWQAIARFVASQKKALKGQISSSTSKISFYNKSINRRLNQCLLFILLKFAKKFNVLLCKSMCIPYTFIYTSHIFNYILCLYQTDDVGSIDDEMIDIAMTKPPSRSISKKQHIPDNFSSRSNRTDGNTDATLNTVSDPKSKSVELHVVSQSVFYALYCSANARI